MGQFDQTARPLAKADGAAFFAWAFSCCDPAPRLTFLGWDDARRLAVPGEPERTNDLVAKFRDENNPARPAWLVAEIEAEPETGILYRMGQYEVVLGKEVNPTCLPGGPAVGSLVLNLSGTQKVRRLESSWAGCGTRLAPVVVDVAGLDAVAHLERMERGEVGLTISPLLALMIGGGTQEFIERWKTAVGKETDAQRLALYREAVVVCAELTPFQVNWIQGTKGWMMRESQYIKGWMKEGGDAAELRNEQAAVLRVVRRLQDPVPESIRLAVEGTTDMDKLVLWHEAALDAAISASGIAELRKTMMLEP